MPISGPNSYPSTMNAFIQHWADLNTLLGTPLILSGTRPVALFTTWLEEVENKIAETSAAVVAAAGRKAELDVMKAELIAWTVTFNGTVRADFGAVYVVNTLQKAPGQSDGRGVFMAPLSKTQQLWADLNSATGLDVELRRRRVLSNGTMVTDLLLVDAYTELINDLQDKWNEWDRARQKADNVREQRNDVMGLAYAAMRDYRIKVPLELPPGHALADSLPLLTPDAAQRPDAPEGSGVWNATTEQADLAAVPSTTPTVVRHELRWSPGEDGYDAENEVILATVPQGGTLTFSTDIGLAVPGDVSRFTWVAVTGNGHEGRSEVVAIVRA